MEILMQTMPLSEDMLYDSNYFSDKMNRVSINVKINKKYRALIKFS